MSTLSREPKSSPAPEPLFSTGQTLARRFVVLRPLGEGGMASVWLVEDTASGESLALKALAPDAAPHADDLREEFARLARVDHPNVVRVHDFGVLDDGRPFFTMDWIDGRAMDQAVSKGDWPGFLAVAEGACSALGAVHAAGLVHGDVKPANVLVMGSVLTPEAVRLVDFGLASRVGESTRPRGTLGFAAPEVLDGTPPDARSDLYSLGVTCYATLARRLPFEAKSVSKLASAQFAGPPDRGPLHENGTPEAIEQVVMHLLDPAPRSRPPSAHEVAQAFAAAGRQLAGTSRIAGTRTSPRPALARGSLVGREQELMDAERASDGAHAPKLVVGPIGSGRTRFLRELAVRAEISGGRAVALSCAGRGDAALEWLRRVHATLGIPGPPSWARVLEALPRAGAVTLALEDLHAASDEDLAIAREVLASTLPPRVNVMLSWAEPAPQPSESFQRFLTLAAGPWIESAPARIELRPLPSHDAAAMVRTLLGGLSLGEVEAATVAHAGGSPAWIEGALEHWIDRGVLRQQDGEWFVQPGSDLGSPPPGFEEVLRERVATLSEPARTMVAAVSLLGDEAPRSLVIAIANVSPEVVDEALAHGVLLAEATSPDSLLRLQAHLVGVLALAALPANVRAHLARRAAERVTASPARVAELWLDAGEPARAIELLDAAPAAAGAEAWTYERLRLRARERQGDVAPADLERAARAADRSQRFRDAASLWMRVAEAYDSRSVAVVQAWLRAAEANLWQAEYATLESLLTRIERALAGLSNGDPDAVARIGSAVLSHRAWLATIRGDQENAEALARSALAEAPAAALEEQFTAWNRLAVVLPARGRLEEGRQAVDRAIALAREMGDEVAMMRALGNAVAIVRRADDLSEETRLLRLQLEFAERQNHQLTRCRVLLALAGVSARTDRASEARKAYLSAESASRAAGDLLILSTVFSGFGMVELRAGSLARSMTMTAAAIRLARRLNAAEVLGLAWNRIGILHALHGKATRAIRCHRRAIAHFGKAGRSSASLFPYIYLADLALDRGKLDVARRTLGRATRLAHDYPVLAAWIHRSMTRLSALSSRKNVEAISPAPASLADIEARGASLEAEAYRKIAAGEDAAAVSILEDAASLYRESDFVLSLARMRAQGAQVTRAQKAASALSIRTADQWADEARTLFRRMGARPVILKTLSRRVAPSAVQTPAAEPASVSVSDALAEVSKLINSILDFPDLLHRALGILVDRLGAERGLIVLVDADSGELTPVARHGDLDENAQADALQISTSIVRRVLDSGHTFRSEDAEVDPRLASRKSVFELSLRSVLCAALRIRGTIIGTIYLQNRTARNAFTEEHVAFLESFSNLVAIAIENSRLHEGLRRTNEALVDENTNLRFEVRESFRFANLVGRSREMGRVHALIERFAQSDADVLIQGETGTGKELIAKTIHYNSPRKERPFLTVSCVALPETLIESELFGIDDHVATGVRARPGIFERAEGGSVLLDEIGDMPLGMQARLLRVLQEREFSRVGGRRLLHMNVRILAATNADLRERVGDGRFRADLYFRVNRLVIHLPSLRERKSDLPLLARHFVEQFCERMGLPVPKPSSELLSVLERSNWLGNVRELEHYIERLLVVCDGPVLYPRVLPDDLELESKAARPQITSLHGVGSQDLTSALSAIEKDLISEALRRAGGKRSRAARALGLAEPTLRYRMKKLGLTGERDSENLP